MIKIFSTNDKKLSHDVVTEIFKFYEDNSSFITGKNSVVRMACQKELDSKKRDLYEKSENVVLVQKLSGRWDF